MRKILPLIFLASCTYQTNHTQNVVFTEPGIIAKAIAERYVRPEQCSFLEKMTGMRKLKDLANDFLKDLGGVTVVINDTLTGTYFDPEIFHQRETQTYKKWRKLLADPRNFHLSEIYEVSYEGHSLPALFSMPRLLKSLKQTKDHKMGVICLPAAGLGCEFDPKFILTFLLRGMHVLAINYSGIEWKKTCTEAKEATFWLSKHLNTPLQDITICGKSFGSGPAVYAAVECPGAHLIIDRGFARFSDAVPANALIRGLIEKYYRFPNEDWIDQVQGKILIIEAKEEAIWRGHAERLKKGKETTLITVAGSHYTPSWYTDDKSQSKLTAFLVSLRPNKD